MCLRHAWDMSQTVLGPFNSIVSGTCLRHLRHIWKPYVPMPTSRVPIQKCQACNKATARYNFKSRVCAQFVHGWYKVGISVSKCTVHEV